jgi:peptidoglycan/xylan/chitin deacetylase (PgdA/CDA1 family)
LTDSEIQSLSKSKYATIGSHAFYHNNLMAIDHKEAMKEIKLSKDYLETLIQKEIKSIAFPDGSYTRNIINDTEKLGINQQLAVNFLYKEDALDHRIMDRFGIYPFYTANRLGHLLADKKE